MRAAPSLRWRLTLAVGTVLAVAVLAPAVVWVSTIVPGAWSSRGFLAAFAVGTGALLLASIAIARTLVREITAPIEAMATRIEYLAETGADLPDPAGRNFAELERLFGSVRHLVDAARARERRLETTVGALAHDMRTGLRAIVTVVGQGRVPGNGELRLPAGTADLVDRELDRARGMASDLVVLMRGRSPRSSGVGPATDVAALACEVAAAAAVGSDVKVSVEVEKAFERRSPKGLIERALRNVLDNAVRHARTSVTVRVFDGLIVVADDGPGFGPRDDGPIASGLHGYGFEIASRLAELVGGRVTIERSDATGTTVLVYV